MSKIIFLGNGLLADYALEVLSRQHEVIFHARTREDLAEVLRLKKENPEAHAVLASFGVMIGQEVLEVFEPEGILNIHPSLLPKYRGASPIETAILEGETKLGVSVMKLVKAMDAGPVYYQEECDFGEILDARTACGAKGTALEGLEDAAAIKKEIYRVLAEKGAEWIEKNIEKLPEVRDQQGEPSFAAKFDKTMAELNFEEKGAEELHREIIAHALYPRSKTVLGGHETLILASHVVETPDEAVLSISASDGRILALDRVQPAGKRPMDAKSFKNGYMR